MQPPALHARGDRPGTPAGPAKPSRANRFPRRAAPGSSRPLRVQIGPPLRSFADAAALRVRGPVLRRPLAPRRPERVRVDIEGDEKCLQSVMRSEEHTSAIQSLMRITYAVLCVDKKKQHHTMTPNHHRTHYKN